MTADQFIVKLLSESHRWLVTGCAGFIGSHLTTFLLAHNQHVTGLDNLSSCGRVNLDYLFNTLPESALVNFTFHKGDIRDDRACEKAVGNGVDFVLHHAAIGSVKASFDDPNTTHEVNVKGFENVMMAAMGHGAQKIVYASSSAVYGDSDATANKEDQAVRPLSPYAQSKISNEEDARRFFDKHGRSIIGLRYFNIYGPRQNPNGDYAAVIPKWIERGLNNTPSVIYGDGSAVRDFCYIDDIIRLNMLSVAKGQGTAIYNGASGTPTKIGKLEQLIRNNLKTENSPVYKPPREGDIHISIADITKAKNDLDFSAQTDMPAGIAETINFYMSLQKGAV